MAFIPVDGLAHRIAGVRGLNARGARRTGCFPFNPMIDLDFMPK